MISNLSRRFAAFLLAAVFVGAPLFAADLSQTAASVVKVSGTSENLLLGGTVTAGMAVRKDASNNIVAAANTSAANAEVYGIALNGGGAGQPVVVQRDGIVNLGATLSVGKIYVLSASGLISPADDVATADYISTICVAITAANCRIAIANSGVAAAADIT